MQLLSIEEQRMASVQEEFALRANVQAQRSQVMGVQMFIYPAISCRSGCYKCQCEDDIIGFSY